MGDISKKEKDEVELSLARIIYTKLDQGTLLYKDARKIAQFILAKTEEVKEQNQLLAMLEEMTQRWPIFDTVRSLYRLKVVDEQKTQEGIQNVKQTLASMGQN